MEGRSKVVGSGASAGSVLSVEERRGKRLLIGALLPTLLFNLVMYSAAIMKSDAPPAGLFATLLLNALGILLITRGRHRTRILSGASFIVASLSFLAVTVVASLGAVSFAGEKGGAMFSLFLVGLPALVTVYCGFAAWALLGSESVRTYIESQS